MGYFVLYVTLAAAGCFAGRMYLHLSWFWSVASAMSAAGAVVHALVSAGDSRRFRREIGALVEGNSSPHRVYDWWRQRRGLSDPCEPSPRAEELCAAQFLLLLMPVCVGLTCLRLQLHWVLGIGVCASAGVGAAVGLIANRPMEKAREIALQHAGDLFREWSRKWGRQATEAATARRGQQATAAPEAADQALLRCNNCGRKQRRGDWEKEMDRRSRAKYGTEFVNLSAPEQCLKCGSTDLVDASQPRQATPAVPSEVAELAARFARAGREWEEAHTLGLSEAQRGVMTHYYSTQQTKKEKEEEIKKLIAEARAKGVLYDVIGLLKRKGETAAVQLLDAYL